QPNVSVLPDRDAGVGTEGFRCRNRVLGERARTAHPADLVSGCLDEPHCSVGAGDDCHRAPVSCGHRVGPDIGSKPRRPTWATSPEHESGADETGDNPRPLLSAAWAGLRSPYGSSPKHLLMMR